MPRCPQCNKPLVELTRQCPSCRADLDLLVEYVNGLAGSLGRAEELTRAGELGQATWAYLEVLEVDPDNVAARRQVSQVATAVRQFDQTAPSKRWAKVLASRAGGDGAAGGVAYCVKRVAIAVALMLAFGLGFLCGHNLKNGDLPALEPKYQEIPMQPNKQLGPPGF